MRIQRGRRAKKWGGFRGLVSGLFTTVVALAALLLHAVPVLAAGVTFSRPIPNIFPNSPYVSCLYGIFAGPNNDPLVHNWSILSRQTGTVHLLVVTRDFNGHPGDSLTATIADDTGPHSFAVPYAGTANTEQTTVVELHVTANTPYDLSIAQTSGTEQHYKLGAQERYVELGWGGPMHYNEGGRNVFAVNAEAGEHVQLVVSADGEGAGVPGQATGIHWLVLPVAQGSSPLSPGAPVNIEFDNNSGQGQTYLVQIEVGFYPFLSGHWQMVKTSGSDMGVYTLPCEPLAADGWLKSVSVVNPPQSTLVNQDTTITLSQVVTNNGPMSPAPFRLKTFASSPNEDCTFTQPLQYESLSLSTGQDTTVTETFTVRCSQPSQHSFNFNSSLGHQATDPNPGNNSGGTDTSLAVIALTDLEVVSFTHNAPVEVRVNEDFQISGQFVIQNNGPYGPVTVQFAGSMVLPSDCIRVPPPSPTPPPAPTLDAGQQLTLQRVGTFRCANPSIHTFTSNVAISPQDPHVQDTDGTNNARSDSLTIAVIALADLELVSLQVQPPSVVLVGRSAIFPVSSEVGNNGPFGPVDAFMSRILDVPPGMRGSLRVDDASDVVFVLAGVSYRVNRGGQLVQEGVAQAITPPPLPAQILQGLQVGDIVIVRGTDIQFVPVPGGPTGTAPELRVRIFVPNLGLNEQRPVRPSSFDVGCLEPGSYTISVGAGVFPRDIHVRDTNTANNFTSVTQSVRCNRPPVADAGADQTVDEGAAVSLNGNASSDPDNDPLAFTWTQTDGPSVTLTGGDTATPSFTAPQVPAELVTLTLTFQLTVNDGFGGTSTDTVVVTVRDVLPAQFQLARTIGYWKNHESQIAAMLTQGPINLGDTLVTTVSQAVDVLSHANAADARDALRSQLLATILDLRNGSNPFATGPDIRPTVFAAKAFLASHPTAVTTEHPDRATAIGLKDTLDAYNNSGE